MVKKLTLVAVGFSALAVIALALPVTAKNTTSTKLSAKSQPDLACVQAAVEKRDTAIISALDTYYAAVKQALITRKDALKAAWGISNQTDRRNALKAAWKAYADVLKTVRKTFQNARKTAWKSFYADGKTCKGVNVYNDPGSEGEDATL